MRSNHTFSILFFLKASKTEPTEGYIFCRITIDGRRSEISLKRKILKDTWNADKGIVKGNKEEARKANTHIDQVRNQLFDLYNEQIQDYQTVYHLPSCTEHVIFFLMRKQKLTLHVYPNKS